MRPVILIESRPKRVAFLHVIDKLALSHVSVMGVRVETVASIQAAVISARAYAPLDRLFASALHLSHASTVWVLPKGRGAQNELETVRPTWQGAFHVERSITDQDSAIIVARDVVRRHRATSVARKGRRI